MKIVGFYTSSLKVVRAAQIMTILAKHSLSVLFDRMRIVKRHNVQKVVVSTPERIRMTIEELGPTFVKFGQILADRPDMVSDRFRKELKKLQSKAVPFDNTVAVTLIEKELGKPIDDVFLEFDRTALAAASIGQVYQARLKEDGRKVVVKIQRPYIEKKIKLDIYILKYIAAHFARTNPELAAINIVGLVDEFAETMLRELDYTNEVGNITHFSCIFAEDPTVRIPMVYAHLCTSRLIIMEFIEGIPPDDRMALVASGSDLSEVARNGAHAVLTMIFKHGFFHADPHAGNIFIQPGNIIALIDFGMVGMLTPRDLDFIADFCVGFARRDSSRIAKSLITLCGRRFFEREDELTFEIYQMLTQSEGVPFERLDIAITMQNCISLITKYKLQIPSGIFMLIKALVTIQQFAFALDPAMSFSPIILPYAREAIKDKYAPRKIANQIYDTLSGYVTLARTLPGDVGEILYKLKEGKIRHEIRISDEDLLIRTATKIGAKVSYVMLLAAMFIGGVFLVVMDNSHKGYGKVILIVVSVLITLQLLKWTFSGRK